MAVAFISTDCILCSLGFTLKGRTMSDLLGFDAVVHHVDDRVVTDFFNSDGYFIGATYENRDGSGSWFTTDGQHGSWNATTQYWQIGGALGLGFTVWGTSDGTMGFGWTSGLGVVIEVGEAPTADAALAEVSQSGATMAANVDPLPSYIHFNSDGTITWDAAGIDVGLYAVSQDPHYSPSDPAAPTEFLNALDPAQ